MKTKIKPSGRDGAPRAAERARGANPFDRAAYFRNKNIQVPTQRRDLYAAAVAGNGCFKQTASFYNLKNFPGYHRCAPLFRNPLEI